MPRPDPDHSAPTDAPEAAKLGSVAVELLYRNERRALVRFFTRYRTGPDDAQDLLQDTFLHLAQLDAERRTAIRKPGAFLRTIARNLLYDRARSALARHTAQHVDLEGIVIPDASQERGLEARDGLARLEAVLQTMKPLTRQIFMAHRLDGMTYPEIARRVGLSVSGVEKQISRAMAHIDRHLDRD